MRDSMELDLLDRLQAQSGAALSEATVTSVDGRIITVQMPGAGATCRVTPAFTIPYRPAVDDQLLVIGTPPKLYAIGLIAGAGQLDLSIAGDISLHARGGKLTLSGDHGVAIEAPSVIVTALRLDVVAEHLTELLGHALRRVRDVFTLQAGSSSTFVEGHASQHSETAVVAATGNITVSGAQVHLG